MKVKILMKTMATKKEKTLMTNKASRKSPRNIISILSLPCLLNSQLKKSLKNKGRSKRTTSKKGGKEESNCS